MKTLISCEYNWDTTCVELKFTDGSMISIDCAAVELEVARNMYERSELDYCFKILHRDNWLMTVFCVVHW